MATNTEPCRSCGQPITAAIFGTLGPGGSMLSSIPTDQSLREHAACDLDLILPPEREIDR